MTGCKFPVYYLLLRASIVCNSVLSIIVRLLFFRWVVNYISYEGTRLCLNIFDLCFVLFTHSQFRKKMSHSSLLMTFGFSANSTYDSNLLLIFGKFALIWGHFQNICVSHLAWADFKIKVKQIAHSIVHFDQWNKLISKM